LLFENPLKEDSVEVIRELKKIDLKTKLISGDNIFTSIEVANQVEMIDNDSHFLIIDFDDENFNIKHLYQSNYTLCPFLTN
jgi:magnesium-transporting ATPase (P-type)